MMRRGNEGRQEETCVSVDGDTEASGMLSNAIAKADEYLYKRKKPGTAAWKRRLSSTSSNERIGQAQAYSDEPPLFLVDALAIISPPCRQRIPGSMPEQRNQPASSRDLLVRSRGGYFRPRTDCRYSTFRRRYIRASRTRKAADTGSIRHDLRAETSVVAASGSRYLLPLAWLLPTSRFTNLHTLERRKTSWSCAIFESEHRWHWASASY